MKKATDTQIFALLFVLAVGLFFLIYFLPLKNVNEEIDSLEAQNSTLRSEVSELQIYHDNRAQYETDTEVLKKEIGSILTSYPSEYKTEDYVMEAVAIEKAADKKLLFKSINIGDPTVLATVAATDLSAAGLEDFKTDVEFTCNEIDYNNRVNYPGLKLALERIFASDYKMNVKQITYQNEDGILEGVIKVGYYYAKGNGREYNFPEIPEYEAGTTNIFIGGNLMVVNPDELANEEQ